MFSGWLKKESGVEEPVGLEAVKRRVLGEEDNDDFEELPAARAGRLAARARRAARSSQPNLTKTTKPKPESISEPTKEVSPIKPEGKVNDVPVFKHKQLQGLNDLIAAHQERENNQYYHKEAQRRAAEEGGYNHYDVDHGIRTLFGEDDDIGDLSTKLMTWAQTNNPTVGKSKKPLWREVQNFINNFGDESLRDENNYREVIRRSRINADRITDEVVDSQWDSLSNKDKKTLAEMGLGGAGGRANMFLKTDEDRIKRGKAILKIYLQQGGRDAYLGGEDTAPLSWKDFTVDHVHSEGDVEFWKRRAIEKGLDPSEYQKVANDPEENYVMTRFGFNGAQKRDNSMERLFQLMNSDYFEQGEEGVNEKLLGNAQKKMRKMLRETEYFGPMIQMLKSVIQEGMDPEAYDELFENYKTGRQQIEDADPRTDRSQMAMGRNAYTDPWRSLAERQLLGMKIFANDGLRDKVGGQIAGWSGVGGTTSGSNAANGEGPSYPYEDGALDFTSIQCEEWH